MLLFNGPQGVTYRVERGIVADAVFAGAVPDVPRVKNVFTRSACQEFVYKIKLESN
jgi:hypothetical protein